MRIQTEKQDFYSESGVIPDHIRQNGGNLEEFLKAYYEWMQSSSDKPGHILNTLLENRNIDTVTDEFIEYLQREFAASIPQQIQADPRKLYKQVNDIYRSKGSIPSYEALFNLLFNDQIELYYPRVDLLKPSDGKWDQTQQRYLNNDGFISDKKFIQDSRYYQNFSYVIKTGQTIDYWQDAVKKLLHPAGFAFFGQVLIQATAEKRYSLIPPGFVDPQEGRFPIIVDTVNAKFKEFRSLMTVTKTELVNNTLGSTFKHFEQTKFVNHAQIVFYSDLTIEQVSSGNKTPISIPSEITLINT
jgi:hypothetical protein